MMLVPVLASVWSSGTVFLVLFFHRTGILKATSSNKEYRYPCRAGHKMETQKEHGRSNSQISAYPRTLKKHVYRQCLARLDRESNLQGIILHSQDTPSTARTHVMVHSIHPKHQKAKSYNYTRVQRETPHSY
eukprot:3972124-Amphidinium_carterae.2